MPYFFTWMVREGSPMELVWPKDGAIISPIFMLTKKETKDKTIKTEKHTFTIFSKLTIS